MCRAVFLRLVSLGVLLFTLWGQITCEGDLDSADCNLCKYNSKVYQVTELVECMRAFVKDASPQTGWKELLEKCKQTEVVFECSSSLPDRMRRNVGIHWREKQTD